MCAYWKFVLFKQNLNRWLICGRRMEVFREKEEAVPTKQKQNIWYKISKVGRGCIIKKKGTNSIRYSDISVKGKLNKVRAIISVFQKYFEKCKTWVFIVISWRTRIKKTEMNSPADLSRDTSNQKSHILKDTLQKSFDKWPS